MNYFSSDFHFGDDRLNLFGRDLIANNSKEIDDLIIKNWNETVSEGDLAFILGDVAYNREGLKKVSELNGTKILIRGNYDQQFTQQELSLYFDDICDDLTIYLDEEPIYLNHYPTNCKSNMFNITAHIHGTWKVQRNMINVGVDAWHFQPVSGDMIRFQIGGIRNHYDQNVFAGELVANNMRTEVDKHKYQLNWIKQEEDNSWIKRWQTNTGECLSIVEDDGIYKATISYEPIKFEGTLQEIEEKFKVKIK